MSTLQIVLILALTGYAIYRQTRRSLVSGSSRFKLALIYGGVGLASGGFSRPSTWAEVLLLLVSLLLSIIVGLARGRLTKVWAEPDGRVFSQGTAVTISMFIGLVAVKFAIGTVAYLTGTSDDGGFGEVLVMIAVMVAFQAQIIWRRAQGLLVSGQSAGSSQPASAV